MCTFSPVLSVLLETPEHEVTMGSIVSARTVEYACEYLQLLVGGGCSNILSHRGLPKPLPSHELLDFITTVEKQFIERVRPEELAALVQTANY